MPYRFRFLPSPIRRGAGGEESVYAALEVKQTLNVGRLDYAGDKVESVRKLVATSAPIPNNITGKAQPRERIRVLGGFLALDSEWNPVSGKPFSETLGRLRGSDKAIDIGCVLHNGSFVVDDGDLT